MAKEQTNNAKKISLTIITPRGIKLIERADIVIMRCVDGDLGVLPGHAPVTTALGDGILRYSNNGIEKKLALFGGTAEISGTSVTILSTIAQRPEEIDLPRAERDRKEVEALLKDESNENKSRSMQVMLHRTLVRIAVSNQLSEPDYFKNDDDDEDEKNNSK